MSWDRSNALRNTAFQSLHCSLCCYLQWTLAAYHTRHWGHNRLISQPAKHPSCHNTIQHATYGSNWHHFIVSHIVCSISQNEAYHKFYAISLKIKRTVWYILYYITLHHISYHVISHIISYHITSYIISYHIYHISHNIIYHIISHHITHILYYIILYYIILYYIILMNCNWVVTRWQWLFYMYTKYEIGY